MNSERAIAYGRIVKTIEELGPAKLQPAEVARIREAADALFFCEDPTEPGAREALADVEALTSHLVDAERWTTERAEQMLDDLRGCGPLAPVG